MDENKRKTLEGIKYRLFECCGLCKHSKFVNNQMFGDCLRKTYKHIKHSADVKPLSINMFGGCQDFELSETKHGQLHAFTSFFETKA